MEEYASSFYALGGKRRLGANFRSFGHTLLHGALLVFIVVGTGIVYRPPIDFPNRFGLRTEFAAVNFVILFAVLAYAYRAFSVHAYLHGGVR